MRSIPIGLVLFAAIALQTIPASAQDSVYYNQRRDKLLSLLADDEAALIPGAWEKELETFRQSNNFFYFTGVVQPNLLLLIAPASRSPEVLYLPARNLADGSLSEAWTGSKLGPGSGTEKITGIARAAERGTFNTVFAGLAAGLTTVYYDYLPSEIGGPRSGAEVLLATITERYPHLQIRPLGRLVDSLRMVKDETEIATLQRAVDITGEALVEAIGAVKAGMYEYEVEALIEYGLHRRGSQRPGFPSIVGAGPNTVTLHYNENRRRIESGELLLMDVGAELDYYTADITRTVPVDGKFTARQREVYDIVLRAQQAGIAAVRPGVTLRDIHAAAKKVIEEAGFGEYFIHYTSHYLGMNVHDVGSRDEKLRAGMVITVEPGIYLPEESLGVRIEDDVLVTENGSRVLSRNIPSTVDELEGLMAR
ncbi:MAG: aminopeptidase P family protein [Candidatus Glassbacteria bacterium]|nr:aminopeptidase P family protein [Candidatus Glassbacteria bacterium]